MSDYVLITPARNEAGLIDHTLASIVAQTVQPLRWVIVNDGSTDATAEIVREYQRRYDFVELVNIERAGDRHFGNKVVAFNRGLDRLKGLEYDFIGNLDADTSFAPDYFEALLREFQRDPALGLAGGLIASFTDGSFVRQEIAADSVAGAVQLFRRGCFEQVGGYIPLPLGGIDAAAEIIARMHGWSVRTVRELEVREHRRTGSASAKPLGSRVREGRRLRALGYDWCFFGLRCLARLAEAPRIVGSCAALFGFILGAARQEPLVLSPEVVTFLRREQRGKLRRKLGLLH